MNSLIDNSPKVTFENNRFYVSLPNEVSFSFPIAGNRRLEKADTSQLLNVMIDEDGLHWPDVNEDLSFAGLLRGDYGQYVRGTILD